MRTALDIGLARQMYYQQYNHEEQDRRRRHGKGYGGRRRRLAAGPAAWTPCPRPEARADGRGASSMQSGVENADVEVEVELAVEERARWVERVVENSEFQKHAAPG